MGHKFMGGRGSRRASVGESKVVGGTGSSGDSPFPMDIDFQNFKYIWLDFINKNHIFIFWCKILKTQILY